jgi:hypothetical protein
MVHEADNLLQFTAEEGQLKGTYDPFDWAKVTYGNE